MPIIFILLCFHYIQCCFCDNTYNNLLSAISSPLNYNKSLLCYHHLQMRRENIQSKNDDFDKYICLLHITKNMKINTNLNFNCAFL